jgi:hypothetical protein
MYLFMYIYICKCINSGGTTRERPDTQYSSRVTRISDVQ